MRISSSKYIKDIIPVSLCNKILLQVYVIGGAEVVYKYNLYGDDGMPQVFYRRQKKDVCKDFTELGLITLHISGTYLTCCLCIVRDPGSVFFQYFVLERHTPGNQLI